MTRKLNKKDVGRSSSIFWSHADDVLSSGACVRLPYTKEDLHCLLNFYSLFAEHLCVIDITLLYNNLLRELVMYEGYDALLSNSIIVPMVRGSVANFEELEYQSRLDETTYGAPDKAITQPYAGFLDEEVSTILQTDHKYFTEALTENFENSLLNSPFLRATGLSPIERKLQKYVETYFKKYDTEKLRRSVFFFFADELVKAGHPKYATRVKWLSSAIYNNTFTDPLNLRPAFPDTYAEALLKILIKDEDAQRLHVKYSETHFLDEIPLEADDIRFLTALDIIKIRKTHEAKVYFKKSKRAARESVPFKAAKELEDGLAQYLPSLVAEISSIGTGRRKKRVRIQNKLRLVKWSGLGGFSGLGLTSLLAGAGPIAWGAFGFGLIWMLAGTSLESKIWAHAKKEDLSAYEQWNRMKRSLGEQRPVINISEKRVGKKAPLF